MLKYKILNKNNRQEVEALYTSTFSSSESDDEGKIVGNLASELSTKIDNKEIIGIGAFKDEIIIAAIFFTRLRFSKSISVYMLSPVAVSSQHQGIGVGQALINYGIDVLKERSVSILITYGDPAFYSKVGFQTLSEKTIQAPFKLSMPAGWLGQSLTGQLIPTIDERPKCVEEFNKADLW